MKDVTHSLSETEGPILLVAPEPFYEDRGTPIALRYVLKALSEQGQKVDLLTYPIGKPVEMPGLRIQRIPNLFRIKHVPIGFSFRKIILDLILTFSLWRLLRRNRYCCIHAVEEAAFPAVMLAHAYAIPVIYDMQSSLPEQLSQYFICRMKILQKVLRALERWLIRNTDFIICSIGLGEYVVSIDPNAKLSEWYFPIVPHNHTREGEIKQLLRELSIPPDSQMVVYCGNFEPYQGIRELLLAAPQIISEVNNTIILLVGAGRKDTRILEKTIPDFHLNGAVRFLKRQSSSMVPKILEIADVVVSPRQYGSNLPLKIMEYMAAGKAIVATNIPAHRKVLDASRAFLVGPNPDELGQGIVQLLKDRSKAELLGSAARAYAEKHFSWEFFLDSTSKSYKKVLGRIGPNASY